MIATIVKHQWFSGSPLPLNEWFGRNHWYQWFFNGFWSINHWPRWFFSLATIGLDGFAMVFGLATIGLNGFSMVANHWSNDGMVTIHRCGLNCSIVRWDDGGGRCKISVLGWWTANAANLAPTAGDVLKVGTSFGISGFWLKCESKSFRFKCERQN